MIHENNVFTIPVLGIQNTRTEIDHDLRYVSLLVWIYNTVLENRDNWGIIDEGYEVKMRLEKQWYPVFIFDNIWLADAFIKYLGGNENNT